MNHINCHIRYLKVQASAKKQNVLLEKVKDGKYIVNGKATVFVRVSSVISNNTVNSKVRRISSV